MLLSSWPGGAELPAAVRVVDQASKCCGCQARATFFACVLLSGGPSAPRRPNKPPWSGGFSVGGSCCGRPHPASPAAISLAQAVTCAQTLGGLRWTWFSSGVITQGGVNVRPETD